MDGAAVKKVGSETAIVTKKFPINGCRSRSAFRALEKGPGPARPGTGPGSAQLVSVG